MTYNSPTQENVPSCDGSLDRFLFEQTGQTSGVSGGILGSCLPGVTCSLYVLPTSLAPGHASNSSESVPMQPLKM